MLVRSSEEVLFHELTGPGHVRVVRLLVEHGAGVAGDATCAAIRRGREEELGSTPLTGSEGVVIAGQELVKGRVPSEYGSHEGRRRSQDGYVVDQKIQVARGVGLGGL